MKEGSHLQWPSTLIYNYLFQIFALNFLLLLKQYKRGIQILRNEIAIFLDSNK